MRTLRVYRNSNIKQLYKLPIKDSGHKQVSSIKVTSYYVILVAGFRLVLPIKPVPKTNYRSS